MLPLSQTREKIKGDLPGFVVFCLSRLFNVVYLSTCSGMFCFFWDRQQSCDRICSIDARASNDDGRASSGGRVKWHCACSSEIFARSNEKKDQSEPWGVNTDNLLMSPDVVSLVSLDYRPELVESVIEVSVQYGTVTPWACHSTVLFLESQDHAGCRWKKM